MKPESSHRYKSCLRPNPDGAGASDRIQDVFRRFSRTIETYGGRIHELRGDALLGAFERAKD